MYSGDGRRFSMANKDGSCGEDDARLSAIVGRSHVLGTKPNAKTAAVTESDFASGCCRPSRGVGVHVEPLSAHFTHLYEGPIGVDNLTNVVRGSFPGLASRWSRKQIAEFGAFLLREAHAIFQHERCRPIRETDLED